MCLTTAVALKACYQPHSVCQLVWGARGAAAPPNTRQHPTLTFHLLFAKFFLICSLTDWWIFLSRAVSPAILEQDMGQQGPPYPMAAVG